MDTHTPEPWFTCTTEPAEIRTHPYGGIVIGETIPNAYNAKRIVACVNACAGMADPAKEIARLKDHSDELDSILEMIPSDAPCLHSDTGEKVADYILGLQNEVSRMHALYFNLREAVCFTLANHNTNSEACIEKLQSLVI